MLGQDRDADLLFSRAKQPDANTVAENGKAPISDKDLAAITDRIQTSFAARTGSALPVTIQPVRQMSDFPLALQEAGARQEVGKLAKGVLYENVVYVVQDAHSTPEEVKTTTFLELYGHAANREGRALAYATWVRPADYLVLTTSDLDRVADEATQLDHAELVHRTPERFLQGDDVLTDGERTVTGHEGRHRALALMQAGFDRVPVKVYSHVGAQL